MYNNILKSDYTFVENPDHDFYGVRLKKGQWKDVIVIYGKVSIKESVETGLATLSFTYQVEDPASYQPDELESDKDFKNYLGDILGHIINTKEETDEE